MAALSSLDLASRLALDYRVARALVSPALGPIRAFKSVDELKKNREISAADGEAGRATAYAVEYVFPILIAADRTIERVVIRYDLLAGSNYPFSTPVAQVSGSVMPWSPHFHPRSGSVCLGDGWSRARGRMLLGQLIVHVMHLLNFDEPDRGAGYIGWNAAAVHHWRALLGCKPLHPDLPYPVLPADITHGVQNAESTFAPVRGADLVAPTPSLFVPVPSVDVRDDTFAPTGARS